MKQKRLKLYYVQLVIDADDPSVHKEFIIAETKGEAIEMVRREWHGKLKDYWVERVKLKHKGFLSQLVKRGEKEKS